MMTFLSMCRHCFARRWHIDSHLSSFADYIFHPAILDAAIHVLINPRMTGNYDPNLYHLPSKIAAFRLCPAFREKPFPTTIFTHATFVSWTPGMFYSS